MSNIATRTLEFLVCGFNCIASTMFEHLERKKTLQSPTEQSRLLENVPAVIADVYEPTPESNPTCDSPVPGDGQQVSGFYCVTEEENSRDAQISPSEKDQTVSVPKEPQQGPTPDSEPKQAKEKECEDLKIEVIAIPDDYKEEDSKAGRRVSENETWCMRGPEGALHKSIPLSVFRLWSERSRCLSEFKVWREDECEEDAIPLPEALSIASRKNHSDPDSSSEPTQTILHTLPVKNDVNCDEGSPESNPPCDAPVPSDGQQEEENSRSVPKEPQQGPTPDSEPKQAKEKECEDLKIEVIAIPSDDEEEVSKAGRRVSTNDELENGTCCMRGPEGELHKSIPLSVFRLWSERSRCWSEFKVWREDECEEDAIPLPEALSITSRKM
ncbi:hypothetical protein PHJA_000190000 [Phtheirospermum japonicum]|uniref:Uncharacterized protein n=1 Tax=Phtheirospermum japonicum TaxID=374723 RepID=A0A830B1H0_9LAMI|nr:hypothetical protein PHJA_000190000 [Phtheirospermum japonicum]